MGRNDRGNCFREGGKWPGLLFELIENDIVLKCSAIQKPKTTICNNPRKVAYSQNRLNIYIYVDSCNVST